VKIGGATFSADLGGSSFYSSVIDAWRPKWRKVSWELHLFKS